MCSSRTASASYAAAAAPQSRFHPVMLRQQGHWYRRSVLLFLGVQTCTLFCADAVVSMGDAGHDWWRYPTKFIATFSVASAPGTINSGSIVSLKISPAAFRPSRTNERL